MLLPQLKSGTRLWIERAAAFFVVCFFVWFSFAHIVIGERSRGAGRVDFGVFYAAGLITRGYQDMPAENVYKRKHILSAIHSVYKKSTAGVFLYPPPAAVMFVPLTYIHFNWAALMWAMFSVLSVLAAYYLTIAVLLNDRVTRARYTLILFALAFSHALRSLLFYGQINGILFLLMVGAFAALSKKKEIFAGFLLGTATVIKIFPALFFPYLLIKKQWIAALSFVLTCIGWFVIALPFFHWSGILSFFTKRIPHVLSADVGYVKESTSLFGSFRASVLQHSWTWTGFKSGMLIHSAERILPALSVILLVAMGCILWRKRTVLTHSQFLLDYGMIVLTLLLVPKATHLAFHLWLIPIVLYWIARVHKRSSRVDILLAAIGLCALLFTQFWKIPHVYSVYHVIFFWKPATFAMVVLSVMTVMQYLLPKRNIKKERAIAKE